MNQIFSPDSPLVKGMNELSALVTLNILTILFSLPVVTAGAAIASMHFVIMQLREGTEGNIIPTFFKQFKGNLRNATPIWLIFLTGAILVFADYRIISGNEQIPDAFLVPVSILAVILTGTAVFAFPLTAKFENTVRATLKNAAILAAANFPKTLTIIVIHLLVFFLFTQFPRLFPLLLLMGISLPADLSSLLYWPVLVKLITGDD